MGSDDDLTEHQIQLLRELSTAGGILIVRRKSEFQNDARLESLGYVTSQSADFGEVRFRITRKGNELLGTEKLRSRRELTWLGLIDSLITPMHRTTCAFGARAAGSKEGSRLIKVPLQRRPRRRPPRDSASQHSPRRVRILALFISGS